MNTHHLLDPAYKAFLDEPSSVWTLANLPAIRRRVDDAWKQPNEARNEQYWTQKDQIRLCIYRPEHSLKPAQKLATLLSSMAAVSCWAVPRWLTIILPIWPTS